ncbi:uncharacterized protein LOC134803132 [Cydia splendana]|uniref:uncharacterized protein LOC134803132 n=1 Tax=Cydia splendana TaxID=1100963 RepID=UPI00300D10B2
MMETSLQMVKNVTALLLWPTANTFVVNIWEENNNSLCSCVSCLAGEMNKSSLPVTSPRRAALPLEQTHSDAAGPMQDTMLGGACFLLKLTDHMRKSFGYLMKSEKEISR